METSPVDRKATGGSWLAILAALIVTLIAGMCQSTTADEPGLWPTQAAVKQEGRDAGRELNPASGTVSAAAQFWATAPTGGWVRCRPLQLTHGLRADC